MIAEDIAGECYDIIRTQLITSRALPVDEANEVAREIDHEIISRLTRAILEYHGEQQNRMADDVVSERRAG